ncbi:hypothetical protein [Oceaniferula spumae]
MDRKVGEVTRLRAETPGKPLILFSGGSTCVFSIAPEVVEQQTGMASYNMGGAVPMGAPYICAKVFETASAGDLVVLMLEPVMLTQPNAAEVKRLGVSLASSEQASEEKKWFGANAVLKDEAVHLRPGSSFLFRTVGKKLLGRKGYRYTMDDFRERGRMETFYENEWKKANQVIDKNTLSQDGIDLLVKCRDLAAKKKVTIVYSLPWTWTVEEISEESKRSNKRLLQEIEEYIPVIREPHMGVSTEGEYFADTSNHLTTEGAKIRSLELGEALQNFLSNRN